MDERKRRILQAITDDYIQTAEPVGSRTIARKYRLGVSPATIRNEMADLEEAGYLEQPHTSAGRIPSDRGYRYYVDRLLQPADLGEEELQALRAMARGMRALEEMIREAARVLAGLSHYTAVVLAPALTEAVLRRVQLIPLDEAHALMVLVTEAGLVHNAIVDLPAGTRPVTLGQLSDLLTERLAGLRLRDLSARLWSDLREVFRDRRLFEQAAELLQQMLDTRAEHRVHMEGSSHILAQPEFRNVERARAVLEALESGESLAQIIGGVFASSGVQVVIGREHGRPEMQECSVVFAAYEMGGRQSGGLALIGPTRMDYGRSITLVRAVAERLSEALEGAAGR